MNLFDWMLLLPVLYGFYRGFTKGLILELASLIALILGVYGALHFSSFTFALLADYVEMDSVYLNLASCGLTFLAIVIAVSLIGKVLTLLVKMVALGFINRMMGALFGAIKALLMLSVVLLLFDGVNKQFGLVKEETLNASLLYTPIRTQVQNLYPTVIEEFERQKENINELKGE